MEVQFWERCFDWFLDLPEPQDRAIWEQLQHLDSEEAVTFISYAERRGLEKGLEQGIEKGIEKGIEQGIEQGIEKGIEKGQRMGLLKAIRLGLKLRFQDAGLALVPQIEDVTDCTILEGIYAAIDADTTLDAIRNLIPPPPNGQT